MLLFHVFCGCKVDMEGGEVRKEESQILQVWITPPGQPWASCLEEGSWPSRREVKACSQGNQTRRPRCPASGETTRESKEIRMG